MFQEVKLERFGMETILVAGLMVASSGMGKMANHLIGPAFRLDDLKVAAARSAAVAALIKHPAVLLTLDDLRYAPEKLGELASAEISFARPLNRLKQINPEAYWGWHIVQRIMA